MKGHNPNLVENRYGDQHGYIIRAKSNLMWPLAFSYIIQSVMFLSFKLCNGSDIFLHRDKTLMPKNQAAWSAWNFLESTDNRVCLTYWLNVLQVRVHTNCMTFCLNVK